MVHFSKRFDLRAYVLAAGTLVAVSGATAGTLDLGYISFDVTTATTAQFDINNLTGANALPPDFPVTTTEAFSALDLKVTFSDGTTQDFSESTPGTFTLGPDGQSFAGPTVAIGGGASPVSAVLTGDLSLTSLSSGGAAPVTVDTAFAAATISDSSGALQDGDTALITAVLASTGTGGGGGGSSGGGSGSGGGTGGGGGGVTSPVPEPGTHVMIGLGLLALLAARRFGLRRRRGLAVASLAATVGGLLAVLALAAPERSEAATAPVTLAIQASPFTGVAGVSSLKLVASGLPASATAAGITVTVAPTCSAGATVAGAVTTTATGLTKVTGAVEQVKFAIPASLAQGTYYASVSGAGFASSGCSVLTVTTTNTTLNSCLPTSSLAVSLGTNVTAYVPNGWWGSATTGVQVVPIEGTGTLASIATPSAVNSCSTNPATGQTVCTANTTDVYLISGSTLTKTLTSGATGSGSFSGGTCSNCGVAVNGLTNTAYITEGNSAAPSGSGIQALNLTTNTFGAPFPLTYEVSENISVDAGRNLLLSPGESDYYTLVQLDTTGKPVSEFISSDLAHSGEFDSAAEDCTTGIAVTAEEFTSNLGLIDLSQASYTAGSPGKWTAPASTFTFNGSFAAGTSGVSVAPGSSHLGITTGEFGGQSFAVFQLPASAATVPGTIPTVLDYAYVDTLPDTPDGNSFVAGYDPHTITAYTSPNNGKPYALIADWALGTPSYVAVIDLKALIAAPRLAGTNTVDQSKFDLLATGAVRYVVAK